MQSKVLSRLIVKSDEVVDGLERYIAGKMLKGERGKSATRTPQLQA